MHGASASSGEPPHPSSQSDDTLSHAGRGGTTRTREKPRWSLGRPLLRVTAIALVTLLVIAGALVAAGAWALRASLARETGTLRLAGLSAEVTVERDALGVPVIRGKTLEDVCRAQGFVHAQERFFQMDLARRGAAGELSALLGSGTLAIDREGRPLRFRKHAREVVERLPEAHRRLLTAYAAGVNAGLTDLRMRPPEYLLLRATPQMWKEEDTMLCVFLMFRFLNYTSTNEKALGTMRESLPAELVEFLTPEVTRWDVPMLVRDKEAEAKARAPMKFPGPEVIDVRKVAPASEAPSPDRSEAQRPSSLARGEAEHREGRLLTFADIREAVMGEGMTIGSNNWAVSGARSKHGGAMVANDMHLGISAPNTWHRVQMEWEEGERGAGHQALGTSRKEPSEGVARRRAVGVSLPGAPSIVAGSNGFLAWGFTNVEADVQDLIIVEVDANDATRYRVSDARHHVPMGSGDAGPTQWEPFGEIVETIEVKGGAPVELKLQTTRWGVVTEQDSKGRPLVLKWSALEADKVNLAVFDMLGARNVEEGAEVARRMFIPCQNVVMADATGRIGWVVCGWLPKRVGFDGKFPHSWAQRDAAGREFAWDGQIDEAQRPSVIDPPEGILWSANNRTVGWPECRVYGNSWSPSDRASRIAAMLREGEKYDERDLLKMQLDVKAESLEMFRAVIGAVDASGSDDDAALLRRAKEMIATWDGTANIDQKGFRLVRAFKDDLSMAVFDALTTKPMTADGGFAYNWFLSDEPLLRILEERPAHLLPPPPTKDGTPAYTDWPGFIRRTLLVTMKRLRDAKPGGLNRTWGDVNWLNAQHPISRAAPFLGRWLDLPKGPLPGSGMTVRAQGRTFGASERFVVSPGREESAIFHMPGGQSGHFLSPHYTDGHAAWVNGDPTPMLAGAPARTLTLTP